MNLTDAVVGDVFRIYITPDNDISSTPTRRTMLATVIATSKSSTEVLLGWKEDHPTSARSRNGVPNPDLRYLSNQEDYKYGKLVMNYIMVASKVVNGLDGMFCKRC